MKVHRSIRDFMYYKYNESAVAKNSPLAYIENTILTFYKIIKLCIEGFIIIF